MGPIVELLRELAPAVPREMTVVVLCDRGIASPKLWQQIRAHGWHPYMRYPKNIIFCAGDGRRLPARAFVPRPDTAWVGRGTAFGRGTAKRRCTLLAVWYTEQEEPWVILTDLPPDQAGVSWYALRFWIELGSRRSRAWAGSGRRPAGPTRSEYRAIGWCCRWQHCWHWPTGPGWKTAYDRRIAPGSLRAPPRTLAPTHRSSPQKPGRTVSVIWHGIAWLRRSLHRGRLWSRVWLLPEPWPEPKSNLEVTRLVPP